ncbi:MAG: hypothetical protein AAGA68_15965 [Pseudomonadota bacterium]
MSVSDAARGAQDEDNALYRLAAGLGLLLGLFLLLGAYGHFEAVLADRAHRERLSVAAWLALAVPGLILSGAGSINIGVCAALWSGVSWALNLALLGCAGAVAYLAYVMTTDLPGHPVGAFLALVASHTVLLGAIRVGLVWPAPTE